MTVQSDTLGAELPREPGLSMVSVARGQVCVCVCVCDGHTFAKGPQGEIKTFSPGGAWATGECASPPDGVPAACHRMRGFLVMGVLPSWEETVGNDF